MAILDIVILLLFIGGVIAGMMKGFIKQLASLLGIVVGLFAAKMLYATVAEKFGSQVTDNMTIAQILSFLLIWILVPLAFVFLAHLLTKALEAVELGWINRILGGLLGGLKFILVGSMVICGLEFIDADNAIISKDSKKSSIFYYPLEKAAGVFMPAATEFTKQLINAD